MTSSQKNYPPPRKRGRPSFVRSAQWLSQQLLLKDGGVLATLRGILAAALIAAAAQLIPYAVASAEVWRVYLLGFLLMTCSVGLVIAARKRRKQAPSREQEKTVSGLPPVQPQHSSAQSHPPLAQLSPRKSESVRAVVDVQLRVEIGRSKRSTEAHEAEAEENDVVRP